MEDLARKLEVWIREQVTGANCQGVVFGLSGGIDSSVVAILCKRAFPESVLAAMMPCFSSKTDMEDAQLVAGKFAIPSVTVNLDNAFTSLVKAIPAGDFDHATRKMAEANMKPRLRMVTLYYLANRLCYLVVGTSNRSEIAVGYSTKYGDSGVDIMPLANLIKRQIRELAYCLGVPDRIIQKAPSAGLWEGQTDEHEMGLTYDELDRYLASGQASDEVRKKVDAMARVSAHKRSTPRVPPF